MELMTSSEIFILSLHNEKQKKIFRAGGMALPFFETYSEMIKFFEIIKNVMPVCNKRFPDEDVKIGEIIFNLPPGLSL